MTCTRNHTICISTLNHKTAIISIIIPNPEELAAIAISSAESFKMLVGKEPKVAMLSHSSKGSAKHADVDKVVDLKNSLLIDHLLALQFPVSLDHMPLPLLIVVLTYIQYFLHLNQEPKVAMLSHSSKGSAKHADVDKVVEAVKLAKEMAPELELDGELQTDAAIVPSVGASKAPDSKVATRASKTIFTATL